MALSFGEAAAQGIESGAGLALKFQDAEERKRRTAIEDEERLYKRQTEHEQRIYTRRRDVKADARLVEQDARTKRQDERQRANDRLGLVEKDVEAHNKEWQAAVDLYKGMDNIPAERKAELLAKQKSLHATRDEAKSKFFRQDKEEQEQEARDLWSRVASGQLSWDKVPPADMARTITIMTGRDVRDFTDGVVSQHEADFKAGLQTKNDDLMMRGLNGLFKPEVERGIGELTADGSVITNKRIAQLIRHPNDNNLVVPMMEVTVQRQDGKTTTYMAPVTENRSADPNDNVKPVSMQEAFERIGQIGTLSTALQRPDLKKQILEDGKPGVDAGLEFLRGSSVAGVKDVKPKKIVVDTVDQGNQIEYTERDSETGTPIRTWYKPKGAPPRHPSEANDKLSADERVLERALKAGNITKAEYDTRMRSMALGGADGGKITEGERKAATLLTRMRGSAKQLDDVLKKHPDAAKPEAIAAGISKIPGVGPALANTMTSEERQQVDAAELDILDASLTLGTGAAYTPEQLKNYQKAYFPQIGDKPAAIADKAARRAVIIRAAEIAAGSAESKAPKFPAAPAPAPAPAAPAAPNVAAAPAAAPTVTPGVNLGASSVPQRAPAPGKAPAAPAAAGPAAPGPGEVPVPKHFKAEGRTADQSKQDFIDAAGAIKKGFPADQTIQRLIKAGYPPDAALQLIVDAAGAK